MVEKAPERERGRAKRALLRLAIFLGLGLPLYLLFYGWAPQALPNAWRAPFIILVIMTFGYAFAPARAAKPLSGEAVIEGVGTGVVLGGIVLALNYAL